MTSAATKTILVFYDRDVLSKAEDMLRTMMGYTVIGTIDPGVALRHALMPMGRVGRCPERQPPGNASAGWSSGWSAAQGRLTAASPSVVSTVARRVRRIACSMLRAWRPEDGT